MRSLARDLGRATGARAYLAALRRTAIGPWEDPPPGDRVWVRGEDLFPWCPMARVDAAEAKALRAGRGIPPRPVEPPSWSLPPGFPDPHAPIRAFHEGSLVAMLRERDGLLVAGS